MSVLIPSKDVFNYVHSGLEKAAYNRTIDQFYSQVIYSHFRHKDIETESKRLIESWLELNSLSYHVKYRQNRRMTKINFRPTFTHKDMQEHQLLKYIQCIDYNIEKSTIEDLMQLSEQQINDLKLLQEWRNDIAYSIVAMADEYKKATWSE